MPIPPSASARPGPPAAFPDPTPVVLTVPGLRGSGPSHWQSRWEAGRRDTRRIELGMWDRPRRNPWVTRIDQAVRASSAPVVFAAHSLGCIALAWWSELAGLDWPGPVRGALLVAPPDLGFRPLAAELADFAPTPRRALPFPAILVASEDDPWISIAAARSLAADWGARFACVGAAGHINAASGLGDWPEGQMLLQRLIDPAAAGPERARLPLPADPAIDASEGSAMVGG